MPESHPRIIAAAQAKVDFYDDLRGHPSQWTEIEYAEAETALKAAETWDAAHGVHRITVDDNFRDRLLEAIREGDRRVDPIASILDGIVGLIEGTAGERRASLRTHR